MKRFVILIILVSAITANGVYAAISDYYNYYANITIDNTNSTPISGPYQVIINASGMIDNYYMQADADDVMISTYSGTEHITAMNLSSGTAVWRLENTIIPANIKSIKTMHIGSPTATRNQKWIGDNDDYTQCWHSASLDIDASTGIQLNADIELSSAPASGSNHYILAKQGAYELYINGTPSVNFKVYDSSFAAAPASGTVQADKACMNDGITGTYCIRYDGVFDYDVLPPSIAANGTELTSIEVNLWMTDLGGVGGSVALVQASLIEVDGNISNSGVMSYNGAGWVFKTSAITRYNGEPWTIFDFISGRVETIRFTLSTTGGVNAPAVSEAWIKLNYNNSPGTACFVSIPISEHIPYSVTAAYSGGSVSLTVGGTTATAAGNFGVINTNDDYVLIGMINGLIDNAIIKTGTPSYNTTVLNLSFDPLDISSGTIADHSGNSNHCYYYLNPNPAGVTMSMGPIQSYETAVYSATSATGTLELLPGDASQPAAWFENTDEYQTWPGQETMNVVIDAAGIPRKVFWLPMFTFIAIAFGFIMYKKTRHLMAMVIALNLVMCYAALTKPPMMDTWMLFVFIIISASMLVVEREPNIA